MDGNAWLCKATNGHGPNYGELIKRVSISRAAQHANDDASKDGIVASLFELEPRQEDYVWIEVMPINSCLRVNVIESGRMPRAKIDEVWRQIQALARPCHVRQ